MSKNTCGCGPEVGELRRAGGDYKAAFRRYQERLGPFIRKKQRPARRFAGVFAPKSKTELFLRNQLMNLPTIPWVADLAFTRDFKDNLTLPEYLRRAYPASRKRCSTLVASAHIA